VNEAQCRGTYRVLRDTATQVREAYHRRGMDLQGAFEPRTTLNAKKTWVVD
jgi:hypothetical protein